MDKSDGERTCRAKSQEETNQKLQKLTQVQVRGYVTMVMALLEMETEKNVRSWTREKAKNLRL